jgi:hypothetical protein
MKRRGDHRDADDNHRPAQQYQDHRRTRLTNQAKTSTVFLTKQAAARTENLPETRRQLRSTSSGT